MPCERPFWSPGMPKPLADVRRGGFKFLAAMKPNGGSCWKGTRSALGETDGTIEGTFDSSFQLSRGIVDISSLFLSFYLLDFEDFVDYFKFELPGPFHRSTSIIGISKQTILKSGLNMPIVKMPLLYAHSENVAMQRVTVSPLLTCWYRVRKGNAFCPAMSLRASSC